MEPEERLTRIENLVEANTIDIRETRKLVAENSRAISLLIQTQEAILDRIDANNAETRALVRGIVNELKHLTRNM